MPRGDIPLSGGTFGNSKRPSSSTIVNQGWLNTMMVAVMCE